LWKTSKAVVGWCGCSILEVVQLANDTEKWRELNCSHGHEFEEEEEGSFAVGIKRKCGVVLPAE